ncbi:ABC-type sugar transport systems, permease components [Candidatus Scalindua japonica]|uniref:ABC-type sugar transport systems, permease components n=1 Tax=Candidatus Scalindua japonica TaxID=1284222 RepID=A0A286TUM4_9BACT|nr:CopG family antitoxin [Candidatus Scalindua japonica]GAX59576.1 ABC-type sugar transport systems, permease components [Candidatus Scalindua japonica]
MLLRFIENFSVEYMQDSTEVLDWKKARKVVLPNLKPSVKTISLRLPESMLEELKLLTNKRDVP